MRSTQVNAKPLSRCPHCGRQVQLTNKFRCPKHGKICGPCWKKMFAPRGACALAEHSGERYLPWARIDNPRKKICDPCYQKLGDAEKAEYKVSPRRPLNGRECF